ncbi:hypothetical protein NPX99_01335 [Bartonella sp. 220]|uniref:hypothetical protein n=1 Tax=Bartonella sp. 220B TaxID=2967260 RepID=UPI0022A9E278|nr:hypothetical protein [Bartonella sp. 220B]MCZ2157935.1 hypothetical protein [Bartonella sp. 220B]
MVQHKNMLFLIELQQILKIDNANLSHLVYSQNENFHIRKIFGKILLKYKKTIAYFSKQKMIKEGTYD